MMIMMMMIIIIKILIRRILSKSTQKSSDFQMGFEINHLSL